MKKQPITAEQFSEFAASRRSTRSFQSTPVDPALVQQLITDGLTAPSWSNTRPYLVAVADGEVRERISAEFLKRWEALSAARVGGLVPKLRLALTRYGLPTSNLAITKPYEPDLLPRSQKVGRDLYGLLGIARGDKKAREASWAENYKFFNAPVELFIFTHKSLGKFAANDAGLFAQNLMLSAHSRGLGTCAQGAVAIWEDVVRKEFDVPARYSLLCGIALGYPDEAIVNSFQAERLPASEITVKPKKA